MPLTNSQYDEIMRNYDYLRQSEAHALEEREREVFEKIPEIKALRDSIIDMHMDAFFSSDDTASSVSASSESKAAFMKETEDKIIKLLLENGYPEDYLELHFKCGKCHDTGIVDGEKCECFREAEIKLLYDKSNLSSVLETENFDTFDLGKYSDDPIFGSGGVSPMEYAKDALEKSEEFLENIGEENNDLLIYGRTGVGKSFLSHCIAKESLNRGYSVMYFSSGQLFDELADAYFGRRETSAPELIEDCDVLIIDDLGTELTNSFVNSRLFSIINSRTLKCRSTIISTNLSLKELQDTYSERIFSRIASRFVMIKLMGNDLRIS